MNYCVRTLIYLCPDGSEVSDTGEDLIMISELETERAVDLDALLRRRFDMARERILVHVAERQVC